MRRFGAPTSGRLRPVCSIHAEKARGTERAEGLLNMNWTQIEGRWQTLGGQLRSHWAKLTDDDLANIAGKRDQLLGKLQERYGVLKDEADKQIDKWIAVLNSEPAAESVAEPVAKSESTPVTPLPNQPS
jgi:uncharacterized protein YjbJ (UPF0337 family)